MRIYVFFALFFSFPFIKLVAASEYFDPGSIRLLEGQSLSDIERFLQGGQLSGKYRVDIYVNNEMFDVRDLDFVPDVGGKELRPRLTMADLRGMGVRPELLPTGLEAESNEVTDIASLIPDASTQFNINALRLDVRIPQVSVIKRSRDEVSPGSWDAGIPAFFVNYSVYGSRQTVRAGGTSNDSFVRLDSGINAGAWRLRNTATYSSSPSQAGWSSLDTYLQRDIQALKSQLVIGDGSSAGTVFDSVQVRGVQLYSDVGMHMDSERGFAPVVRGIAKSDAQVTIRQNDRVIYQIQVAPGAFAITDLYPSFSSGDLHITVRESDGSEQTFVQPFSAVPIMQREGSFKYALTVGEYRSYNAAATPMFFQSSIIYGVDSTITVYTGTQLASNYRAVLVGAGHGLGGLGALSLDVTHANATLQNESRHVGQSYRVQYAKDFQRSGTTFTLAGYRYSTEGFYDFRETNEINHIGDTPLQRYNKRSRFTLDVSQRLGDFGSLFVTGTTQDYWRREGKERSLRAGYYGSYAGVSYSINYSITQSPGSQSSKQVSLNFQVPLSGWSRSARASYQVNRNNDGQTSHEASVSGVALPGHNLSYSASQRYGDRGEGVGGRASAEYKGAYGDVNASYSYGKESAALSYGMSGAIVAHPYGMTLSQPLGEAAVLVRAPGASGVELWNHEGVKADSRGYAVVPNVSAYRKSQVSLNTSSLPDGVDVYGTSQVAVPTRGALVLADFETRRGGRALITLRYRGKWVPFGSTATLEQNGKPNEGIVGQGGEVYLSGLPSSGRLQVQWGKAVDEQCVADFSLLQAKAEGLGGLQSLHTECL